ncbi:PaaI family thioesterase [Longispora albida]|uniref:PaaI family thioesterase n=1 Tax=Longispora albida TaxID=203523 RepID=UPI000373FD2A|nr:PaaI family thioesterase [Longispora albida]
MGLTPADGNAILAANFAPWVLDLGLTVEKVAEGTATLRLPWSDTLAREGGALSGQAMMAAADTASVIALSSLRGEFFPMTTVQLSCSFQRPVIGEDTLVVAEVSRAGKTMGFVDIALNGSRGVAARVSTVYALLG